MEITLTKLIPLLIYPLGLVFLSLLIALLWLWRRRETGGVILVALSLLVILISSNGYTASWLYRSLESRYPPVPIEDVHTADAIVVLGGGLGAPLPPRLHADLNGASDRYLHGTRLYKAGKAPVLILSGGHVFDQEGVKGESNHAAELLMEWGVPESAIVIEDKSRNTLQNAQFTREILVNEGWENVILVTSAAHMPRSVDAFNRAGVEVFPAATDYVVVEAYRPEILSWIPNVDAMRGTTLALKEYIGALWYKLRTDK